MSREDVYSPKPLRLWPGLVAAGLMIPLRFLLPIAAPDAMLYAILGSVVCGLAVVLWWTFFSRAPRVDRWSLFALAAAALAVTWALAHVSIATGAMGMLVPLLGLPLLGLAIPVWALVGFNVSPRARRSSMAFAVVLACAPLLLIRTEGMTSSLLGSDFHWRWTPTSEERLLRSDESLPVPPPLQSAPSETPPPAPPPPVGIAAAEEPATAVPERTPIEWPGFRGPNRDGVVRGVRIETDWAKTPPVALWRRPIGPGWSSFAVRGDRLYTQEQRGDDEIVACYRVSTGEPVWTHRDRVRFWESNGGAGPRATPTLGPGRVYAFGATGILNALDEANGRIVWSRNVAADSEIPVPEWGFSSSPLLVGDLVIVAAAGKLVAYDAASGAPRWSGADDGPSYSSPHLLTIAGVPQVVLLTGRSAAGVVPADGLRLWELKIPASGLAATIVQPAITADGDLLVSDGEASRMRRVAVAQEGEGWAAAERWATSGLKPLFNDFVVHEGHAFGFDGTILASIDVADGQRKWKGGRYGNGQLLLLADQALLLVISEEGELALVRATPDKYTEIARVPALEGKTWNHPVLAGDVLLVRNGEEMAAFRLALER